MFKVTIKTLLYSLPSSIGLAVASFLQRLGLIGPQHEIFFRTGRPQTIQSGPFQGMQYIPDALCSAWLPKLLGIYELELHPKIEQLLGEACDVFIDVGSAEGYYAVGFSLKLRPQKTWAFDIDPRAKDLIERMALANGVADIVQSAGFCDNERLEKLLQTAKYPLLFCDCEGYEMELLDPVKVPSLVKCRVLVETHDHERDGQVISTLRNRFEDSHAVETIITRQRTLQDIPKGIVTQIGANDLIIDAVNEHRVMVTDWLMMRPYIR